MNGPGLRTAAAVSFLVLAGPSYGAPTPPSPPRGATASAPEPARRYAVANAELRVLPRAANGRDYMLYVALPASYAQHPERRYPVLYACDGYWDFNLLNGLYGNLIYDRVVPEYILVGLGYPDQAAGDGRAVDERSKPDYERLRRWDLSPVVDPHTPAPSQWGHGADFLAVIETEIIPFVERHYRVDPSYRVLGGSSLGGLFTLYALFARPGLFSAYIAPSPVVGLADAWLFKFEEEFSRAGKPLKARLFMSGAEREDPKVLADIKRFDDRLAKRAYPSLAYQFRIIEGERHAGTKPEGYNRGVRFAFEPRAPNP